MLKTRIIAVLSASAIVAFSLHAEQTTATTPSQNALPSSENQGSQKEEAAWLNETRQLANDYVEGLDKGQYAQSWTKGDQLFQHTITQQEWEQALNDSRKKLGNMKSRTLKDQKPAYDPKGLPRGPYMVVEYNTSFENAPNSGELLTLRRGSDGKWRVLTYQIN